MLTDPFTGFGSALDSPATAAFAIVPSDADQALVCRAIYVGAGGDIKITGVGIGSEAVTLVGVPQGSILPIRAQRIWATGTTASGLVGLY